MDDLFFSTPTRKNRSPNLSAGQSKRENTLNSSKNVPMFKTKVKGIENIKESFRTETEKFESQMQLVNDFFVCDKCDFTCPFLAENIARKHCAQKKCFKTKLVKIKCKVLTCDECGEQIEGKWKLKKHIKIHAVLKHKCSICDSEFLSRDIYRQHMKDHEKLYSCDECDSKFTRKVQILIHKNKKHGDHVRKSKVVRQTIKLQLEKARTNEIAGLLDQARLIFVKLLEENKNNKKVKLLFSEFEERYGNFKAALKLNKSMQAKPEEQMECTDCG